MKLTPEQEARLRRDFVDSPNSRLVHLTPGQDAALDRAIDEEEAGRDENAAHCRRLETLLEEDSIFGALRRAIETSPLPRKDIAAKSELTAERLRDFFWGDTADLTGEEVDRLARTLHLRLVPAA